MTEDEMRDAYARFYAGDATAHLPFQTDDVVGVDRSGAPDAGAHVGKEAVAAWGADLLTLRGGLVAHIDAFLSEDEARAFACG